MTQEIQIPVAGEDIELALTVSGTGPDLLLVHGLGSAQVLWDPLVELLSPRYRCWNLDLRGHGASGRSVDKNYRLSDYARDVGAALDHIDRPTIGVGHSLGGVSIVRAASGGHAGLRALYVLDSPLFRDPSEQSTSIELFSKQLAMVRTFQAEGRPIDDYEDVLGQAQNPMGGTNSELMVPSQLRGRAESLSQLDPECIAALVEGRMVDTLVQPQVHVPLRLIAADPAMWAAFPPESIPLLVAVCPQAEVETMIGVGHQLMMMQGFDDKVTADLTQWLERLT